MNERRGQLLMLRGSYQLVLNQGFTFFRTASRSDSRLVLVNGEFARVILTLVRFDIITVKND